MICHDKNTEKKIKEAAKTLFLEKGFNLTTSREIVKKAWVNLSLLNYHFWSKKELFDIIILETFKEFSDHLFILINNEKVSFQDKIIKFCNDFFDFLIENELFFIFIQKEATKDPENIAKKIQNEMEHIKEDINLWKSILIQQYQEATKKDISDFRNFFTNIFSLIIYPILGRKILTVLMGTNFKEYQKFLQGRKKEISKLIPVLL